MEISRGIINDFQWVQDRVDREVAGSRRQNITSSNPIGTPTRILILVIVIVIIIIIVNIIIMGVKWYTKFIIGFISLVNPYWS